MPRSKKTTAPKKPKVTAKKSTTKSKLAKIHVENDGSRKILITDDDPALSRVLALKFKNAGFEVMVCHDGAEAIEAMHEQKFHGMILDLIMPKKTGFDVLAEKPKTINKDTPAFVMSDMRTPETVDQAMALGAVQYFVKMQIPLNDVIAVLSQYL